MYQQNDKSNTKTTLLLIFGGLFVGFANGFFGGGGGMLAVPLITYVLKLKDKESHATALTIILPMTIISAVIYIVSGKFLLFEGISVGVGVIIGGMVGAIALSKFSNNIVSMIFAIIMLVAGVRLIW